MTAFLPGLPVFVRRGFAPPLGPWGPPPEIPEAVRSVAGIRRDQAAEEAAFRSGPVIEVSRIHSEAFATAFGRLWQTVLPERPRIMRAVRAVERTGSIVPVPRTSQPDPNHLTSELRAVAGLLGLSAIGVAPYDPKYTYAGHEDKWFGSMVIVCVLEQNYQATQLLPGVLGELAAESGYADLMRLAAKLADSLHALGFRARADTTHGSSIIHPYAVESGLGQMGMNGQLLTPAAGSRCRLSLIYTDAPLVRDNPRDFGLETICDACRVCVRRCPAGAIPGRRTEHRGVVKNKLNMARCFPVIAQANACGICMKVCPVQKYGLGAVLEEFEHTGKILGKGSDELESYDFDGQHYAAGVRPKLSREFMNPTWFPFDPDRTAPPAPNEEAKDVPGF